jgi:hypothetical protein
VASLCAMQQKSLKVSPEVYSDLKAYAAARGGLPLGRAIGTLLNAEKQRQIVPGVKTPAPDEQHRRKTEYSVGHADTEAHLATPEPRVQ